MARTVLLKTSDGVELETFTNDDELKTGFDGVAELDECGIPTGFIRDARLLKEDRRYRCRAGLRITIECGARSSLKGSGLQSEN